MANGRHSYVAFYPSDWMAGAARLPRLHRSVYFDLCCYIWDTAKPVPAREVPLMLGDLPEWAAIVNDLVEIGKLHRLECGGLVNAKALHEAEKAKAAWERMSEGGKLARSTPHAKGDGKGDDKPHAKGSRENQNQNQNQKESPYPPLENPFAGEAWDGWIEQRKKPPTDNAVKLAIGLLTKLKAEGQDPDAVLNQSTMNGWTGLFAIKGDFNGTGFRDGGGDGADKRSGLARAIDQELERTLRPLPEVLPALGGGPAEGEG